MKRSVRTSISNFAVSTVLWFGALLSACTVVLHATSSAIVVVGTYFSAWATRMQVRFTTFFHRYGMSLESDLPPQETPAPAPEPSPETKTFDEAVKTGWADSTPKKGDGYGRPPRGQA